jgi:glucosamine--fructose-6-phosphate aminotransferase (isomerizing)
VNTSNTGSTTVMAREIAEQPGTVAATLDRLSHLHGEIHRLAAKRRSLLFVGRGTSDNAATYGRYLCEIHCGRPSGLAAPSVATHYRSRVDLSDTTAVSLSQSGQTAEIVETQQWARENGAATIAITNDSDSDLARQADVALTTAAGVEQAVPATKTYSAQLTALAVLADALAPRPGLSDELRRVPTAIEKILAADLDLESAAALVTSVPGGQIVIGRGVTQTTALEVGLKLEETCLRPVRGLSYADFQHGPKAVLSDRVATIVTAPSSGPVLPGLTELARTARAVGSPVLGIGGDSAFAAACTRVLPGPELSELLCPIALIVTGQLLVEATARLLGLNPDRPRGLTKITQTDPPPA